MSDRENQPKQPAQGAPASEPQETFRGTLRGRTPDGAPSTLIVTRKGLGRSGRTWLTFNGAIKTTVVLTDQETTRLAELLTAATTHRSPK